MEMFPLSPCPCPLASCPFLSWNTSALCCPLEPYKSHSVIPRRLCLSHFQLKYGVNVFHLWGMTELSPVGTLSGIKAPLVGRSQEQILANKTKQGRQEAYPVGYFLMVEEGATSPPDNCLRLSPRWSASPRWRRSSRNRRPGR